jgi:hypothetical protein
MPRARLRSRWSALDRTDVAGRRTLASMGLPVIGSTRPWLRWRVTALVAAALGYARVGGGLRPFSWPAMVATALGGLAILILAWRRGRSPASVRASREGLVAWTLWLVAVTGWELWALSMHPRSTHPTISSLLDSVVETHPGRSVAVLAWLALGCWLARR